MTGSSAVIEWIGGPVLRAQSPNEFRIGEAIEVGENRLPGEVIRLKGDVIVAQVYEDTTGLRPGDAVTGSGGPLSVRLGPTLLGNIFDGLLRPLESGAIAAEFDFSPFVAPGQELAGGAIFGAIPSERIVQKCLLPPNVSGIVESIIPAGRYGGEAVLCRVRTVKGEIVEAGFFQSWPVRIPRPVKARLPADEPMITGQRILDVLFPVARGGRAALPGGFGTGKTVLQETLAKWCDADIDDHVGRTRQRDGRGAARIPRSRRSSHGV